MANAGVFWRRRSPPIPDVICLISMTSVLARLPVHNRIYKRTWAFPKHPHGLPQRVEHVAFASAPKPLVFGGTPEDRQAPERHDRHDAFHELADALEEAASAGRRCDGRHRVCHNGL